MCKNTEIQDRMKIDTFPEIIIIDLKYKKDFNNYYKVQNTLDLKQYGSKYKYKLFASINITESLRFTSAIKKLDGDIY